MRKVKQNTKKNKRLSVEQLYNRINNMCGEILLLISRKQNITHGWKIYELLYFCVLFYAKKKIGKKKMQKEEEQKDEERKLNNFFDIYSIENRKL